MVWSDLYHDSFFSYIFLSCSLYIFMMILPHCAHSYKPCLSIYSIFLFNLSHFHIFFQYQYHITKPYCLLLVLSNTLGISLYMDNLYRNLYMILLCDIWNQVCNYNKGHLALLQRSEAWGTSGSSYASKTHGIATIPSFVVYYKTAVFPTHLFIN